MSHYLDKGTDLNSPPLQGRGKGWGLSREKLDELKRRAREMRNNPTEPEKRLWRSLASAQLDGFKFRRQEVIGHAIADFYCPAADLVVEIDGHTHADFDKDRRRDAYLGGFGLRVLHVSNHDVMGNIDGVLVKIQSSLGGDKPHPNPSPEGEGLS